jgi:hypothetical protein
VSPDAQVAGVPGAVPNRQADLNADAEAAREEFVARGLGA